MVWCCIQSGNAPTILPLVSGSIAPSSPFARRWPTAADRPSWSVLMGGPYLARVLSLSSFSASLCRARANPPEG
jgi:hypothetical protein